MKESSIRIAAAIVLLSCTIYIVITGLSAGSFRSAESYFGKVVKPTGNQTIDHPAFITFFPKS